MVGRWRQRPVRFGAEGDPARRLRDEGGKLVFAASGIAASFPCSVEGESRSGQSAAGQVPEHLAA